MFFLSQQEKLTQQEIEGNSKFGILWVRGEIFMENWNVTMCQQDLVLPNINVHEWK